MILNDYKMIEGRYIEGVILHNELEKFDGGKLLTITFYDLKDTQTTLTVNKEDVVTITDNWITVKKDDIVRIVDVSMYSEMKIMEFVDL